MKALILDNQVVDVQDNTFPVHPSLVWIDCDDSIKIGDTYKDGKFSRVELNIRPPIDTLRKQRNRLLAATDWRDLPSYAGTKQAEWRVYRQALRDITVGLDTVEKVTAATFPTQPS